MIGLAEDLNLRGISMVRLDGDYAKGGGCQRSNEISVICQFWQLAIAVSRKIFGGGKENIWPLGQPILLPPR